MSFITDSVLSRVFLVSILFATLCTAFPATRVSSSASPVSHHHPGRVIGGHHRRALEVPQVDKRVGRPLKQHDPLGQARISRRAQAGRGGRGRGRGGGQRGRLSQPSPSPWLDWYTSVEVVVPELAEVVSESAQIIPESVEVVSELAKVIPKSESFAELYDRSD